MIERASIFKRRSQGFIDFTLYFRGSGGYACLQNRASKRFKHLNGTSGIGECFLRREPGR